MEKTSAFIKTFPITWVYTLVIAAVLYFVFDQYIAVSFALGSLISLMAMSMLLKSSNRVLDSDETQAKKIATKSYAVRYMLYAMILVVAAVMPNLEVLATAAGLFSFKICLYISLIIQKRGEK